MESAVGDITSFLQRSSEVLKVKAETVQDNAERTKKVHQTHVNGTHIVQINYVDSDSYRYCLVLNVRLCKKTGKLLVRIPCQSTAITDLPAIMKGLTEANLQDVNPRSRDLDLTIAKLNVSKGKLSLDHQYSVWGEAIPKVK